MHEMEKLLAVNLQCLTGSLPDLFSKIFINLKCFEWNKILKPTNNKWPTYIVCLYIICYTNFSFAAILLYILLYLSQRNIWVYYFNDLIKLCIAFGLHKASRQILKYGDVLLWSVHGVVSGSFMCHWRAVHGLLYFRDEV